MLQHILLPFKSRLLATKEESNLTKQKCANTIRVKIVVFVLWRFSFFFSFPLFVFRWFTNNFSEVSDVMKMNQYATEA